MNTQQIALVRHSFSLVEPIAADAASLFYDKLFASDPEVRQLFNGDMTRQGKRLMEMIGTAVALLDRPAAFRLVLQTLGARHAGYQVRPVHYDRVGAALIDTLEAGLGAAFTPEVRSAWVEFYASVRMAMLEGAREPMLES